MSTISPSLQIGGVNGWKGKEGAVLGWQQTSGGLFKPAKNDFTRLSGSASYVDENGLIQIEHRPDYPRFTYQDGKQCLMNEEARTNILTWSEDFTQGIDTTVNVTVSSNSSAAPDDNTTADKLIVDSAQSVGTSYLQKNITKAASALDYSLSIFAKPDGLNTLRLYVRSSASAVNFAQVFVNISTGVISTAASDGGTFSNASATVTPFANGFYRVTLSFTSGTDTQLQARVYPDDDTITTGDGVAGILAWGIMGEQASYASSYIPTEGSAVTRAAESIEGLNLGNFLGDSQGGLYVEALPFDVSSGGRFDISNGANANRAFVTYQSTPEFALVAGSSTQAAINGGSMSDNVFYKTFFAYALNDFAAVLDGTLIGTDSTVNAFTDSLSQLTAANPTGGLFPFRGLIHEVRAYNQRPANSQMETQTA